jgi:membrane protease YdiL (CAAX protease family)
VRTQAAKQRHYWRTVRALLNASLKRARGQRKHQQELLEHRSGKPSFDWSWFGFVAAIFFSAAVSCGYAFLIDMAAMTGEGVEAERHGKIVVSDDFLSAVVEVQSLQGDRRVLARSAYADEAGRIARRTGVAEKVAERHLRDAVTTRGSTDLTAVSVAAPGLPALPSSGAFSAMLGSIVLLWWLVAMVFQGEGPDFDVQRRRHPMWEWLFSHPVSPGAVFAAEMLSPIAANPAYLTGTLFVGCLYGFVYGPGVGVVAAVVGGIPIVTATACVGRALAICATLRLSPRSRGATLGLMAWLGQASMLGFIFLAIMRPDSIGRASHVLAPLTAIPWPWLGLLLGQVDGHFSLLAGVLACWGISGVAIGGSVWLSVWSVGRGLSGNIAAGDLTPVRARGRRPSFESAPLYRKELLWLTRDRGAIVQIVLIPLSVAGLQVFNLRFVLHGAQGAWYGLCGAAIVLGTYFLWILGPRSLASEGTALWIALTWPLGLERLLKAKAWLWTGISSAVVVAVLLYVAYRFPADGWKVALVGLGWFVFSISMAEKAVTLVSVPSSSGEQQKVPATRRWAASLGMLTFAIGVFTQQWHLAVIGIVYSYLTAAAMWQNFRARLPFLYDPWSERLPQAPTLMHAMIAISILVEAGAVLIVPVMFFIQGGREAIAAVQVVTYGLGAAAVCFGVSEFLAGRGISFWDLWTWPNAARTELANLLPSLALGAASGIVLGLLGRGYLEVLMHVPSTAEIIRHSQTQMAQVPGLRISYFIVAVAFAPFAEEFLFRGMLFRALDREWGGWRAVVGSAAFFAIYHPVLSWLPVGLLGVTNALLFKRTGRLAPAVALHTIYNIVVLS